MTKAKSIVISVLLAVVLAIASVLCFADFKVPNTIYDYHSILSMVGKGIDLSGGYYVVLEPESEESNDDVINRAMEILRARLDDKGYSEATISVQDNTKIRIEIPKVDNAEDVLKVIGSTGELTFQDSAKTVYLTGDDVESASVGYDNDQGYVCVLNFTSEGMMKFSSATAAIKDMSDNKMYIYLGDTVVSQPSVTSQITNRSAEITGFKSYDEADAVASVIESGRLPINYTVSEARAISARLGETAINKSILAGVIGMALIFIIMLVFYKGMGLASDIALFIYALLFIIVLALVPAVQLTLPGIAGILLSIGMAVDANVVIFERIKDEYRSGKTAMSSIDAGFKRALITVIDSNVTTILAAIVLWILCPGTIKGFAITLFIGILLSMFTSIVITRSLIKLFLPFAKFENRDKFLGLSREEGEINE
ncbi:MAG: protein translocase subunit SecD [Christensenellaceae bacterium]